MSAKEYHSGRRRAAARPRQGTRTALYLRVSTAEQKPDLQYDGLRGYAARAGLDVVRDYCDVAVSGRREGRPQLSALMAAARNQEIDCVLVWKFYRFARSTRHLLVALEEFDHLGVRFVSVQDQIDTDSPMGRAMFTIIGAMAELESSLISERVTAGMRAAEARGRHLGRPATSTDLSIRAIQKQIAGRASRGIVGEITKRARAVQLPALGPPAARGSLGRSGRRGDMGKDVIVLGAGIVGVSAATHLRRRGWDVVVVDRQGPGDGASSGNAGLIQREAVYPHGFPRAIKELARIARNVSIDAVYHPLDLPGLVAPLVRYWWNSQPKRYTRAVLGTSRLIETCVDEHESMAEAAGAGHMLRRTGWLRVFDDERALDETVRSAEASRRDHGVTFEALDGDGLALAEPHLMVRRAGAVHFTNAPWVADPHALVEAYARRLEAMGGRFATGDAMGLSRAGEGWRVPTADGVVEAGAVVVALGAHSARLTSRFGYSPPMFGERGYHMHYGMQGNAVLNHPMMDMASGFMLSPMRAGIRLATGAEFARLDSAATPVQLERAEPVARKLLPLGERLQGEPWLGVRPCMPDMVPVISAVPKQAGMWGAFGHGSVGLTLGPSTGRLLAEMMDGAATFIDPAPYRADRF